MRKKKKQARISPLVYASERHCSAKKKKKAPQDYYGRFISFMSFFGLQSYEYFTHVQTKICYPILGRSWVNCSWIIWTQTQNANIFRFNMVDLNLDSRLNGSKGNYLCPIFKGWDLGPRWNQSKWVALPNLLMNVTSEFWVLGLGQRALAAR